MQLLCEGADTWVGAQVAAYDPSLARLASCVLVEWHRRQLEGAGTGAGTTHANGINIVALHCRASAAEEGGQTLDDVAPARTSRSSPRDEDQNELFGCAPRVPR